MSTLKADTIVASDGTSPVTLTKQSAAKAFHQTDFSGTAITRHSLNITSITDSNTQHTCNFTNSFSDIYQVWTDGVGQGDHSTANRGMSRITRSASSPVFLCESSNGNSQGAESDLNMLFHGDLA